MDRSDKWDGAPPQAVASIQITMDLERLTGREWGRVTEALELQPHEGIAVMIVLSSTGEEPPALADQPMAPPGSEPSPSGWSELTDRELTIAAMVGLALTNRQIAKRLHLSAHTVNYYLRQIFRKLGINSRVQLARLTNTISPG